MNKVCALAAALLAAGSARATETSEVPQFSVSLGGGFAYEIVGLNLALRVDHVEGYLGLGLLTLIPGAAFGARWFPRPDGAGFFLGLNGGFHSYTGSFFENGATGGRFVSATLTPGYRFAWEHFFLQAAVGGGFLYALTFYYRPPSPTKNWTFFPDAMLALGLRF